MTRGKLIGKLIKQSIPEHPQLCQVTSTRELHNELVEYLMKQNEKLYAIQCDVADCYNQLDSSAVFNRAWYLVKTFALEKNKKTTFKCIAIEAGKSMKFTPTNEIKPQTQTSITLTLSGKCTNGNKFFDLVIIQKSKIGLIKRKN